MTKRNRGPLEGKHEEIVRQRKEHIPVREIARIHGVSRQSVHTVINKAKERGETFPKKAPRTKTCPVCGNNFHGKAQTCSRECATEATRRRSLRTRPPWSRVATVDLRCERCGRDFKRTLFQNAVSKIGAKEGKRDYCGRKCYMEQMEEGNMQRRQRVLEEAQKEPRPDALEIVRRLALEGVRVSRGFVVKTLGKGDSGKPGYRLWKPGKRRPSPLKAARDFVKTMGSLDKALEALAAIERTERRTPHGTDDAKQG